MTNAIRRRHTVGFATSLVLGLALPTGLSIAQEKSAKELIVGTWNLSIADHVRSDGTTTPGFGPLPVGTATFAADGTYSLQVMPHGQTRSVSSDRPVTTVGLAEPRATGNVSSSGTYAIDETQKSITLKVAQSSLPGWSGTTQTAAIKFLVGDDLGWRNPKALTADSEFVGTELIWCRAK